MMEAIRTSETSVNIQLRTWQYIPEDSELQVHDLTIINVSMIKVKVTNDNFLKAFSGTVIFEVGMKV
jgi:hypothetical protein